MSLPPSQVIPFLHTLLDTSEEAIVAMDSTGLITSANRRAEEQTGYLASQLIGHHSVLIWHAPDDLQSLFAGEISVNPGSQNEFAAFAAQAQDQSHRERIWTITRIDGSQYSARLTFTSISDDSGVLTGYLAIYRDVTEQLDTLKTLQQEERRFEDMVNYSAMGMATVSLEGGWITLNQAFCDLVGYTQEEMTKMTVQETTHPDDLGGDLAKAGELIEGKITHYHIEKRYIHKNGSIVWVLLSVSIVRDETSAPLYFIAQVQDITQRKLAAEELAAGMALLKEFIDHAPVAIAMLDTDMRYLHISNRWITDYGLDSQNVIGRSHYEVFNNIPQRWKNVHQRVLQGASESSREDDFVLEDGSVEWLNWEARPWHNSQGEIGGLILFTRNITKQKESQQELERLVSELERSNRELEQFAYVASHDMQEPLRAVAACAEILQARYGQQLDDRADELITHIVDGATRMQGLIQDLLQLSRINARSSKPVEVDTARVCQGVLQDLSREIKKSSASIEFDSLPVVLGDRTQIKQVFQNLVSNALKYRGLARPKISITATLKKDYWEFAVSDNGIGIDQAYFRQIFGIFQRLHTRNDYPGTGIGLALCEKIVVRHGGKIWLSSTPGKGSVFYFTLPQSYPKV